MRRVLVNPAEARQPVKRPPGRTGGAGRSGGGRAGSVGSAGACSGADQAPGVGSQVGAGCGAAVRCRAQRRGDGAGHGALRSNGETRVDGGAVVGPAGTGWGGGGVARGPHHGFSRRVLVSERVWASRCLQVAGELWRAPKRWTTSPARPACRPTTTYKRLQIKEPLDPRQPIREWVHARGKSIQDVRDAVARFRAPGR